MEQFAEQNNVPIIMENSLVWLAHFFADKKITNILEIGSAIGYSALQFNRLTGAAIVGVERDETRHAKALENTALTDDVTIFLDDAQSDAFFKEAANKAPYDILFIDATKRQNQLFFEKFAPLVKPGGYIITDNLAFHGLAKTEAEIANLHRRIRPMIRSIIAYSEWLETLDGYTTDFIDVGDKLAITKKIERAELT